jgi:CubicO group peptidase (beta-lactamase class C family)
MLSRVETSLCKRGKTLRMEDLNTIKRLTFIASHRTISFVGATLTALTSLMASDLVFPEKEWTSPPADATVISFAKVHQATDQLKSVVGKEGNAGTMIVQNGHLLWAGENISRKNIVWSCTKSVTSTCLGLLWDDGKCSPEDFASAYLPELAKDYPTVTLKQLATFTSGLQLEKFSLEPGRPNFPPGTAMHYSNETDLLAYLLTKIAGEPLRELFKRRIADPIGMDPEGWEWKSVNTREGLVINGGVGMAENGMYMTAKNLARFGWLFANGGNWNGRQLISKTYMDYATVPLVEAGMPLHDPTGWYQQLPGRYGLNWWTNGTDASGKRLWPHVPPGAFAAQGNHNNICIIVPDWKLVLVRTAQDEIIDVGLFDGALKILGEGLHAE